MQPSILASVFYIIAFVALVVGLYSVKKADDKVHGAVWLPLCFVAVMCFQAFAAAVINLVSVPVNIWTVGTVDLIPAAFLWYKIIRGKERQKYIYTAADIVLFAALFAVVILFAIKRYGTELNLSYASVDGASHLFSAMRVWKTQSLDAMFYSSLHNALLIELFSPIVSAGAIYKIYVLGDVLHLFLGGLMFWGAIRTYATDRFLSIAGMAMVILYLLGYPANSTIFGFSYLGMNLTVTLFIITVVNEGLQEHISEKILIILLSLGCLAVFESYMLFVPVIYFGILIYMFVNQYRGGRLISLNTIYKGLAIFLIPTLIGLWYSYRGVFGNGKDLTVGKQISLEGGIYRNLFTNFVFILPLAVVGVIVLIKKRKNHALIYFLILEIPFTGVLFLLSLQKKVSGYYYYKNYFILWTFVFVAAYIGVSVLEKHARFMLSCGFAVWLVIVFMFVLRIDVRIQNKNDLLYGSAQLRPFMDVYATNYDFLNLSEYDKNKLELYGYLCDNVDDANIDNQYNMVGSWEDSVWARGVLGNWVDTWSVDDVYTDNNKRYVVVLYDSVEYNETRDICGQMERIFENSAGYIAVIE